MAKYLSGKRQNTNLLPIPDNENVHWLKFFLMEYKGRMVLYICVDIMIAIQGAIASPSIVYKYLYIFVHVWKYMLIPFYEK